MLKEAAAMVPSTDQDGEKNTVLYCFKVRIIYILAYKTYSKYTKINIF